MEGHAPRWSQQRHRRGSGPAPTGRLAIVPGALSSDPAPTQVLTLPPLRGANKRAGGGRIAVVAAAVVGLVLGAVSIVGGPAALAGSARTTELAAEAVEPDSGSPSDAGPQASVGGDEAATPTPAPSDTPADTPADGAVAGTSDAPVASSPDESSPDESTAAELLDDVAIGIKVEEPGELLDEIVAEIGPSETSGGGPDGATVQTGSVVPAASGVVHLTFDDGPHPEHTPAVLDVLARYDAKATFFVLGSLVEAHPEIVERIVAEGHTVANHTWRHEDLTQLTQEQFNETVGRTQAALGPHATGCLRPPYGSMNADTRAWAAELGLEVVLWDTDTLDWQRPGVDVVADSIVDGAVDGRTNILLHDGGGDRTESVLALDQALAELSDQGFRFEPVCR